MISRTALLAAALLGAGACQARTVEGKVALMLPPGAAFGEAQLTSQVFENTALLGPHGGPTHGYVVAVELWPEGPDLLVEGQYGKGELASDATFKALWKPALKLDFARDGHAIAVSHDGGKSWRGVWIDGPVPILCTHTAVTPPTIVPTRTLVREILTGTKHDARTKYEGVRGRVEDAADERTAALAYATAHADDPELAALAGVPVATRGVEAAEAPPAKARECTLGRPTGSALPADATPAMGLALFGFTPAADKASCAQWQKVRAQVDAVLKALPEPVAPATRGPTPQAVQTAAMCFSMAQSVAVSQRPFGNSGADDAVLASAGQPAIASFQKEAKRCGHIGQRDRACEAKVKERKRAEWFAWVNAARLEACTRAEDLVATVKRCFAAPEAFAALDPFHRATVLRLEWSMVSLLARTMGPASCPVAQEPVFPSLD